MPAFCKMRSSSGFEPMEKSPSMNALRSLLLTISEAKRPPMSTPSASTMIDLPEPVSPVSRFNPRSNSTRSSSIRAMFEMLSSVSISSDSLDAIPDGQQQEGQNLFVKSGGWAFLPLSRGESAISYSSTSQVG